MSSILVFPGQGSQSVGMGKELYDNNPAARAVFDEVDDALNQKLSDIIFNGPMEDLTLTTNVQPAIMAVSIAMLRASGIQLTQYVAGHSLGEYTALCAAGALSVGDTARLLRLRGDAMQRAVPVGAGLTAVILGLPIEQVREICAQTDCDVANDNSPGQVVVSGARDIVEKTLELAKSAGAKRAMPLALSVPVHCRIQAPAAEEMRAALEKIEIKAPNAILISNKTAAPMSDPNEIKEALVYQITHGVRWRESVLKMHELGINETIEVGPGAVLTGLTPRICSEMTSKKLEI
ncbi:MAG TPA: ACP S-malonyltransferase [Candidatus Enterousia intestinigallinarum]|uniref:Malonyl CoA-acyl carrier protein transacylase n=1 Tax=Candidatus Enterousia intestinigallinarum TaxID=2840790 RepID=A0A9D1FFP8_9PROT|nr:ACP S-malonyltransferase [Candidatus Enterousia intestinigallinarum]